MKYRASLTFLPVAISALFLSACNNKETEERLDRLEAEIRAVRSDTRDEVATIGDRVDAAELKLGNSSEKENFAQRLDEIDSNLLQLRQNQGTSDRMAYLRPHLNGHTPLQTDHGTFLVRIEGMDLNLATGGYDIHLNIGNPFALAVQQFTLKGDFGGGVPELAEGEEVSIYNKKIEAWQKTLKPFEASVTKTLKPYTWTPFDLQLPADTRDQLELIRFTMAIENAHLDKQSAGGGRANDFAHLNVDSKAASVIRTDYGAFLILIKGVEKDKNGTRLNIEIGNPYGFSISQCRLLGDFGKKVPKRTEGEDQQAFAEKLQNWTNSLQPFETAVTSKLSSFRWNRASVVIPGTLDNVEFLRCQLRIEVVTLPNASGK